MESPEGDAAGPKTKCRLSITALTAITDRHLAQTIRNAIKNHLEELLQIPNLPMLQAQIMAIVHKVVQKRKRRSSNDLTPQINDFERKLKECDLRRQLMRYSTKINPNEEFYKATSEDDSSDSDLDDDFSSGASSPQQHPLLPSFATKMLVHGSSPAQHMPFSSSPSSPGIAYQYAMGPPMMQQYQPMNSARPHLPSTPPLSSTPELYKALDLPVTDRDQHQQHSNTPFGTSTLPQPRAMAPQISRANSAPSFTQLIPPHELLRSKLANNLASSFSSPIQLTPSTSSLSWRNDNQNDGLKLPPISSLFPSFIPPRDDQFKTSQQKGNNAS